MHGIDFYNFKQLFTRKFHHLSGMQISSSFFLQALNAIECLEVFDLINEIDNLPNEGGNSEIVRLKKIVERMKNTVFGVADNDLANMANAIRCAYKYLKENNSSPDGYRYLEDAATIANKFRE